MLGSLVYEQGIEPHIPVFDKSERRDWTFGRAEFSYDEGLDVSAPGYQDPHELAHANDIRRHFANREVTTGQIIMSG
mgnify:CR=1 FL=1